MSLQPEVRDTLNTLLKGMSDQELIEHINGWTLFKNKPKSCKIPAYRTFIALAKDEAQKRHIRFRFASEVNRGFIVKTWSADMKIISVEKSDKLAKHGLVITFEGTNGKPFILSWKKVRVPRFWYIG